MSENAKTRNYLKTPSCSSKRKFLIFMGGRRFTFRKGKYMEAVRGARAEVGAALDVREQHRVGAV